MAVDLGAGRRMEVTGYALRHGGCDEYRLWSWELHPSAVVGGPWVTLDRREGDETLSQGGRNSHYYAGLWDVNRVASGAVRHVRILQTGGNSSGNHYLCCGGLELYGVLREH
jgi:hypothetical protein